MENLKIAVAQFEPKDGDKSYNLKVIEKLTAEAKNAGAEVISFHEMSITAYTFLKNCTKEEAFAVAEEVPAGSSTTHLIELARKYDITILAGLVELELDKIYNTYICVDHTGLKAKFRKLHPFISAYLSPGNEYCTFEIKGWKCGILICYDNNIIENVRATSLLGANIIFAPHVTGCTPSPMPGRGYVAPELWDQRATDPVPLRLEFDGPKGREWIMRWLPARAYDNGVYYIFTNPIGYDGEHLKNGNSMILDPYGNVVTEIKSFDDSIALGVITADKLSLAGGYRYKNARRPELYKDIIGAEHTPLLKPIWMSSDKK